MSTLKTWEDLERLATGDPWLSDRPAGTLVYGETLVHRCLTAVEIGQWTREEALIQLAFALVETKNHYQRMLLDYINSTPRQILIPAEEFGSYAIAHHGDELRVEKITEKDK